MSARIATDNRTLRNVFARFVEEDRPTTFAERMKCQMRAFKAVATARGEKLTADRVEHWGALFATVCERREA